MCSLTPCLKTGACARPVAVAWNLSAGCVLGKRHIDAALTKLRFCVSGLGPMSAECSGMNYALRLHEGKIEVCARPFQRRLTTLEMGRIKSIELLRKSVMPPAAVGALGLSLGLVLRIAGEELVGIVPLSLRGPLQYVGFGVAVACLTILTVRWFFANLILKPANGPPITVRMVPTHSARRFVALVQRQTFIRKEG